MRLRLITYLFKLMILQTKKHTIVGLQEKSYPHLVILYKNPKWQKIVMSIFYHWKKQAIPGLEILAKQNPTYAITIQKIITKIQNKK
ncbi:hypothetical protein [Candidatus Uabimicrobium sp. HlEnr_7]|uniref:hypothetical protein n=1 Tax=Candidatus Uabimicrobium helgolandensis TaxID=3095367 RepID=UPI003556DF83